MDLFVHGFFISVRYFKMKVMQKSVEYRGYMHADDTRKQSADLDQKDAAIYVYDSFEFAM